MLKSKAVLKLVRSMAYCFRFLTSAILPELVVFQLPVLPRSTVLVLELVFLCKK